MNILIAGGTGFVGKALESKLTSIGHSVYVLTRNPRAENHIAWNPLIGELLDNTIFSSIDVLINLSGESINAKRWTSTQKKELFASRVASTHLLFEKRHLFSSLKQFVTASGITAYPFDDSAYEWKESDDFGKTFIAQLVKEWEGAANLFLDFVPVCKLRIAVVLGKTGGTLPLLVQLTKRNLGGPVGSGKQQIPWVSLSDLVDQFVFALENKLSGVYNTNAGNISNKELMEQLRLFYKKKFCPPAVPSFVLQLLFGEKSILMLKGNKASNAAILKSGYTFRYTAIKEVLQVENL